MESSQTNLRTAAVQRSSQVKTKSTSIKRSQVGVNQPKPIPSQAVVQKKQPFRQKESVTTVGANSTGSVELKKARFTQRENKGSPNNISSGDNSQKAANKSFQFGHHTALMRDSSGGGSSNNTMQAKRIRSSSGKNGPQIQLTRYADSADVNTYANPIQPNTSTSAGMTKDHLDNSYTLHMRQLIQLPATTQNNISEQKKFSFAKDLGKKFEKKSQKHSNLIISSANQHRQEEVNGDL